VKLASLPLAVALALATAFADRSLAAAEHPNIVVFLSDDHSLADSSVYGSTDMDTPNMQRLANAGLTFDRAFVASPSCAPSRAALLTGMLPQHNGAEANHSRPKKELKKLPAYLQELGYEVVAFGKVGHYAQTPEYGFDIARHFKYHEDIAVGEAIQWLNARTSDKPLCLFVGTNWPHVPWPKPTTIDATKIKIPLTHVHTPETRRARARYYQAIRTMDDELGRVYDAALAKLGKNTFFLHTSDHGAQWPFAKWNLYDAGIRTPLIVAWPGKIAAGVRTDAMVSWIDILPTLVEVAGGTLDKSLDGRYFLPVLLGKTDKHRDEIYTTHSGDGDFNVYPSRSLRDERYKYILNLHPEFEFNSHVTLVGKDDPYWPSWVKKAQSNPEAARKVQRYQQRPREELYDLATDPLEEHNLAAEPAQTERLAAMRAKLEAWMKAQGDTQTVFGKPKLLPAAGLPMQVERANR
jgi:arylsulfatase A-like enzyme